jgi:hypothetical protein
LGGRVWVKQRPDQRLGNDGQGHDLGGAQKDLPDQSAVAVSFARPSQAESEPPFTDKQDEQAADRTGKSRGGPELSPCPLGSGAGSIECPIDRHGQSIRKREKKVRSSALERADVTEELGGLEKKQDQQPHDGLRRQRLGVRDLVRALEASVVQWLDSMGISAYGKPAAPGVYVRISDVEAKIAALGLKVRNGCTYHGLAVNVAMDVSPFADIDPCGYPGLAVTQVADFGVTRSVESAGAELAPILADHLTRR